ncbi:MAG: helix-hairpin-helix domain-containing protein, partial [Pirellulales bacterium]
LASTRVESESGTPESGEPADREPSASGDDAAPETSDDATSAAATSDEAAAAVAAPADEVPGEAEADGADSQQPSEPTSTPIHSEAVAPVATTADHEPAAQAGASAPTSESTEQPNTAPPIDDASSTAPAPSDGTADDLRLDAAHGSASPGDQPAAPENPTSAPPPATPAGKQQRPRGNTRAERAAARAKQKVKERERLTQQFRDYFNFREPLGRVPPHRVLAINRGERVRLLRVRVEFDRDACYAAAEELLVPADHPHAAMLQGCARDALDRLVLPSLERELRRELTDRAEEHAVEVFARNLRNLLLQPPVCGRRVLAIDPGLKSGCKLAAIDEFSNLLEYAVVHVVGKPAAREAAGARIVDLVTRHELSVIAIGNGTGCRHTEELVGELLAGPLAGRGAAYVILNEAGASVYSASPLAREEFPNYDATQRGTISIGRRLQDPLSELVKIEPASLGIGLYQHDLKAKHLRGTLDDVVESCVNFVGVDLNTASPALLRYVSGLNQLTARRVYDHRREHGPFKNREGLKQVSGVGEAAFTQAAGFLKIADSDNPLDATWIHPESYEVACRLLDKLGFGPDDVRNRERVAELAAKLPAVDVSSVAAELNIGQRALRDILADLARPGRDPREDLPPPIFKQGVLKLEDLTSGMELRGTILNVVDFGAFVDVGLADSGLVHISQLADRYVADPHDVVAVGDIVRCWVVAVDRPRRRVSLTMIDPTKPRRERPPAGDSPAQAGDRGGHGQRGQRRRGGRSRPAAAGQQAQGTAAPQGGGGGNRGGQGRGQRPSEPPRRKRPPVPVQLTDAMKKGKAPVRSFAELKELLHERSRPSDPPPQTE